MNRYVTKKENICLFKTSGEEQGGSGLFRRGEYHKSGEYYKHGKSHQNGTTSCKILSALIREFNGEIAGNDKMIHNPFL